MPNPAVLNCAAELASLGNGSMFGYVRHRGTERVVVPVTFSEREGVVEANQLRLHGLSYDFDGLASCSMIRAAEDLKMSLHESLWLKAAS